MTFRKTFALAALLGLALALPASAEDKIGNCVMVGKKGSTPIANPAKPGQLTVEVSLPAPVWWNGDTPEAVKDGMEYCLAAEIAWRAGYDKLEVVNTSWDALISGQTSGFDLVLSEVSITDERRKVHDFSVPYFDSDMGVLSQADKPVDATSIKSAKIGVQVGTTGAKFVQEKLGLTNVNVYDDLGPLFTALQSGQIDAAVTDTSIVLGQEKATGGKYRVVGQYKTGEVYGAIYPKGNANNPTLDHILQSIVDDGTMTKFSETYLATVWGRSPDTVPYFNP